MSIQSEITRISGNVSDSLAACATKGVTVPSGSTSDDLSGLILQIAPSYTVTKTLTNVTSSNDDTQVLQGGSFYADLTPSAGYLISSITVTMGGIDVTDQVFSPGIRSKRINENGIYIASDENVSGYNVVQVSVPNSYSASDEGKVVSSGALVAQTSATYTTNNTYDTTLINSVTVNVSGGGSPNLQAKTNITPTTSSQTITADTGYDGLSSVQIDAIPSQYIVPTGTKSITANGTGIDVTEYASVDVAVPAGQTIYSGTFTPETKTLTKSVTVGSSAVSFVVCFSLSSPFTSTGRSFCAGIYDVATSRHPVVASNSAGSSAAGSQSGGFSISQSGTTLTMTVQNASGSGYFVAGITYKWYAW